MTCVVCVQKPACKGPCQRPTQTIEEYSAARQAAYPELTPVLKPARPLLS
jgi:hypothetical protein